MELKSKSLVSKAIGQKIRERRKELKLTQIQFSHLLEVDKQYIYKIEKGKVNLSIAYLYEISKTLKIDISKLFDGLPILLSFITLI